jgi:Protein of unknown function (DUF3072)
MTDDARGGSDRPVDPVQDATKDPDDWVTGDEPMTGPQRSYLETLAREAREDVPADLTKAEASKRIDELQARTGRGDGGEGRS